MDEFEEKPRTGADIVSDWLAWIAIIAIVWGGVFLTIVIGMLVIQAFKGAF